MASVTAIVHENIRRESRLHTDESRLYIFLGAEFAHTKLSRTRMANMCAATCTPIGRRLFFDLQARHEGHLPALQGKAPHRYLAEFDFRYNNRVALGIGDIERTIDAVKGAEGKRPCTGNLIGQFSNTERGASALAQEKKERPGMTPGPSIRYPSQVPTELGAKP